MIRVFQLLRVTILTLLQWNKDSAVLSILFLVMCIETFTVCAAFIILFCCLCWRLKITKLSTLLKHVLYLTVINTAIMMFATILAVYSIYRHKQQLSEASFVALFDFFCAGEPFLCLVSVLFQSFLSVRYQNHRNCICCK